MLKVVKRGWSASVLLAVLVGGCAGGETSPEREVNLAGYSAAFKQGYSDGCVSARGLGTRKDAARYGNDTDYMMGWNDGNSICGRR